MAVESLLAWSGKQEPWQQDALRRVAISLDVSEADLVSIVANLKRAQGIDQTSDIECVPLGADDLRQDAAEAPLARLCSIGDVLRVNRLAPNQKLPFALDGITIIYGENGSGKSGYCRIAKKLCRARIVDELHPNVFEEGEQLPGEATVRYLLDGESVVGAVKWVDGQPSPQETAHISVFDSHNARLYVDQKNRIEYLPYELEILTRYGQLLVTVNDTIAGELTALEARLRVALPAGYTPRTEVHALIEKLTTNTATKDLSTAAELSAQAAWTPELQAELEKLEKEVGADPKVLADRCRRVQGVIATLAEEFRRAGDDLAEAKAGKLEEAATRARTAAEAAVLASSELFKNEPLKQVGSDPWQLMFQHAKAYSLLVYPEKLPPRGRQWRTAATSPGGWLQGRADDAWRYRRASDTGCSAARATRMDAARYGLAAPDVIGTAGVEASGTAPAVIERSAIRRHAPRA